MARLKWYLDPLSLIQVNKKQNKKYFLKVGPL